MLDSLENVSDYKLTDLLGSASATIGIIIAGTIFLQSMSTKFMELTNRYRTLTGEYRGGGAAENRHGMLQAQIRNFRRRLWLINRASWLAGVAVFCFLISVLVGGLSMVYPPVVTFKGVGTCALFIGLVLIGGAVILQFIESILAAHEIDEETGDLDGPAKSES